MTTHQPPNPPHGYGYGLDSAGHHPSVQPARRRRTGWMIAAGILVAILVMCGLGSAIIATAGHESKLDRAGRPNASALPVDACGGGICGQPITTEPADTPPPATPPTSTPPSKAKPAAIDNGLPQGGRPQITLKRGQWFTSERCGKWSKIK